MVGVQEELKYEQIPVYTFQTDQLINIDASSERVMHTTDVWDWRPVKPECAQPFNREALHLQKPKAPAIWGSSVKRLGKPH